MFMTTINRPWQALCLTLLAFTFFINGEVNAMESTSKKTENSVIYTTLGRGKPLIVIPDSTAWEPSLQNALEKHYTLIMIDVNSLNSSAAADSIADTIHALGLAKVYVLGLSSGSIVAEQLAISHPDMIEKLILCAPCTEGIDLKALSAFKAPTLLAGGRDDKAAPPEHLRKISGYVPHAWTAYFEGKDDFLIQEWKHFADLVQIFLKQ